VSGSDSDRAWRTVRAAADAAAHLSPAQQPATFTIADDGGVRPAADGGAAAPPSLVWEPDFGWRHTLAADDPRTPVIDLYLPICSATRERPLTLGHLGQSLDGFIATHAGDSRWVTGEQNMLHMHRLRALCDAVMVGAGTVAIDDPQLTTRLVEGPNPLRVVIDPDRRLTAAHRVFTDPAAETLYVCARGSLHHDAQTIADWAARKLDAHLPK